jgi:hypothetical protein
VDGLDAKLAAVAACNHSVITYNDVVAAGGTKHHIRTRLDSGRWILVHKRVYRLAGAPWTWEGIVYAAVCAGGRDAAASFFCAARLHGFGFMTATAEISVPRDRRFRPSGLIVHESTDLDRCRIVKRRGIDTTDEARTLLDIAGALRRRAAFARAVNQARRLDKITWHELVESLAVHARRGRNGVTWMRELIEVGMADDEITDTDSELIALTLIRENGLPEPTTQHRVYADDGRLVAEMDEAYVDRKLNFEIDGNVHLQPEQKEKDDARDAELRDIYGWTVRRIWWEIPVRRPAEFLRIVRSYLH